MSKHYQEAEALRKRARIALEQAHDAAAESSPSGDICRISAAVETLADVVDDLSSLLRDVLEAGDAKPTKPKASPTDAEALEVAVTLLDAAAHIVGTVPGLRKSGRSLACGKGNRPNGAKRLPNGF